MLDYDLEEMLQQYLETAKWASTAIDPNNPDEDIEGLEEYEFHPHEIKVAREDCADFLDNITHLTIPDFWDSEQLGHDFWLTRNGHGAGFWGRSYGVVGDKLSEIAQEFGEVDIYIDEQELLHFE